MEGGSFRFVVRRDGFRFIVFLLYTMSDYVSCGYIYIGVGLVVAMRNL